MPARLSCDRRITPALWLRRSMSPQTNTGPTTDPAVRHARIYVLGCSRQGCFEAIIPVLTSTPVALKLLYYSYIILRFNRGWLRLARPACHLLQLSAIG